MFETQLSKYKYNGSFTFSLTKGNEYHSVCNAPTDKAGIYLIYKIENSSEHLIYIGSSGRKTADGRLKIRNGGLYDRLVEGYHPNRFDQIKRLPRRLAFPLQMAKEGISEIKIYWWVTHEDSFIDFPTDVESEFRNFYLKLHKELPSWHRKKK